MPIAATNWSEPTPEESPCRCEGAADHGLFFADLAEGAVPVAPEHAQERTANAPATLRDRTDDHVGGVRTARAGPGHGLYPAHSGARAARSQPRHGSLKLGRPRDIHVDGLSCWSELPGGARRNGWIVVIVARDPTATVITGPPSTLLGPVSIRRVITARITAFYTGNVAYQESSSSADDSECSLTV